MGPLHETEIQQALESLDGWLPVKDSIEKTFQFADFAEAMAFVNEVAGLAEEANHHPDIAITWNKVRLTLSTHSEGGVTRKDIELAGSIEDLV